MCKRYKKCCRALNLIKHLLILASAVTGYVSFSAIASLVGFLIGIVSSSVGLKFVQ